MTTLTAVGCYVLMSFITIIDLIATTIGIYCLSSLSVSAAQLPHNRSYKLLCVTEQHQRVVEVVERIVNAGEAGVHAALDDHDGMGFVDVEDGHAEDRARFVGAGGRVGDVVGADDKRHVGLRED